LKDRRHVGGVDLQPAGAAGPQRVMPRKAYSVPSVTTSEGTLATATMTPFSRPHSAPTTTPASTASGTGVPGAVTSSVPVA
jgi:hypothetical protein